MKKYDAKLEMAILVALTYAYYHRFNRAESRHQWMQRVGYVLAATLYVR
jgi:hypothetical protein